MRLLKEHEILHMIDCVKQDIDQERALMSLIGHCKHALVDFYYGGQYDLRDTCRNSQSSMESKFALAVHRACFTYDETREASFTTHVYYGIRTEIKKDRDAFVHKKSGITRMRNCPKTSSVIENDSWTFDEYTCGDQCEWQSDKNALRPCKSHYNPPRIKPNLDLAVFYKTVPNKHTIHGSYCISSNTSPADTKGDSSKQSSQNPFIESLDTISKNNEGEKGADVADKYMFGFLQETFQLNPTEDESIVGPQSREKEVLASRLDNLPKWMRGIIIDLIEGVTDGGVFNVEIVAEKHGTTPDEVMEMVLACIQRMKRLDQAS